MTEKDLKQIKKLVEQAMAKDKADACCPSCGRCQTCGKANTYPWQYVPYYPVQPLRPYWYGTISSGLINYVGNNTGGWVDANAAAAVGQMSYTANSGN